MLCRQCQRTCNMADLQAGSAGNREAYVTAAKKMRKEVMMVHNLLLLGFRASELSGKTVASVGRGAGELHAAMFDRPNEKMLFQILHFLLLKLHPQSDQEFRFCWPIITPHDKSNFKKLAQSVLHDLEKGGVLPLGSSQASRLNAGSGPRIVDLIWRLSTHVMKAVLARDCESYHVTPPPSRGQVDVSDAIRLLKARVAMKSRQFKEESVIRSQVQDEWVSFAACMTQKIQEVSALQQLVYDEQNKLDASVNREIYSQCGTDRRNTQLQNTEDSWRVVHGSVTSDSYRSSQSILYAALQHHGDQPVLEASQLRPQRAFSDRVGALNLVDVVRNAEALIQLTRRRFAQQDANVQLSENDKTRMATLTRDTNSNIAHLTTKAQQLRDQLVRLKKSNEKATRDLYIEMAAMTMSDHPELTLTLCPPTPADKMLQESDIVQSLKKCSIQELSSIAAQSVRKSAQKKKFDASSLVTHDVQHDHSLPITGKIEDQRVLRKLNYDFDDDSGDQMEL